MTDNSPRKSGTLSIAQPDADHSTFGKQEPSEAMVPVKVLRGYWPKGTPGDVTLDPLRPKLKLDTLCTLPEGEAQEAADNSVVRILTSKGYRDAQEAAAVAPPPPGPRTMIIEKSA